jgi:DMSO reductase family type II enzyme heme b subunit
VKLSALSKIRQRLRHPFWQAVALFVLAYLLFKFGVRFLPPLVGIKSAPIPATVLAQYMITALVGILIFVSDSEDRWKQFKQPIHAGLVDADKKWIRRSLLVLVPLTVGFVTYEGVRPSVDAGAQLRSIHPAPPGSITFRGKSMTLAGLDNPLRSRGTLAEHVVEGRRVYYQNCVFCHGDQLDGLGPFAHAFNPAPANFADNGTIAQLTESYVFWRIAKGGRGLPREGTPWNSAMPAWEDFLTEDQIWSVIIFLYDHTGWKPRTWSEEAPAAGAQKRSDVVPRHGASSALSHAAFLLPSRLEAQAAGGTEQGRKVFEKWCAGCHGDQGRGDGPAAGRLLPKPRDFTRALFQIRSTANGEIPTDADIRRVVDEGMGGGSMPAWKNALSSSDRAAVVQYVKSFSNAFAQPAHPLQFGSDPGGGQRSIDSGRALFRQIQCFKCHGEAARGDGHSAPTLKDDWGNPIRAADLTQNWMFNGGGEVQDIYHRLRTGLDGTPMPTFGDQIDAHTLTDGDLWRVAHYIRSLSPRDAPRVRDVVNATRMEGKGVLPSGPDDSAWARVERYYFPLVGQVIWKPRWFAPTVNGVWVQALHNGRDLAVRVTWHDPSQSPDSTWRGWRARMARAMSGDDSTAGPVDSTSPLPDRLVIEFPQHQTEGMERPHFLMGSAEQPVYLWQWESAPRAASEVLAKGPDHLEPMSVPSESLIATSTYDHGEWRVQFVRSLATADSTDRLQFLPGRPIPMAIFAWDGSNGETGTKMAVASWVAIYLGEPARALTIVWPLLAMLGTGGLGLVVVVRAQRAAGSPSANN